MNSSGPFSKNTPIGTNPAVFKLPPRQEIDEIIDPNITPEQVANDNLINLYISNVTAYRNQSFDLDWRTYKDLAEHSNMHVINKTFGDGPIASQKIIEHQELMYNGMLAGMSFSQAHKYALRVGPIPATLAS